MSDKSEAERQQYILVGWVGWKKSCGHYPASGRKTIITKLLPIRPVFNAVWNMHLFLEDLKKSIKLPLYLRNSRRLGVDLLDGAHNYFPEYRRGDCEDVMAERNRMAVYISGLRLRLAAQ